VRRSPRFSFTLLAAALAGAIAAFLLFSGPERDAPARGGGATPGTAAREPGGAPLSGGRGFDARREVPNGEDAAASILGVVLDERTARPVADAEVRWFVVGGGEGGAIQTDPDGRFRTTSLAPGTYRLTAAAEGLVGRPLAPIGLVSGARADVVIHLVPVQRLAGRVVDERGAAVPDAEVRARLVVAGAADTDQRLPGFAADASPELATSTGPDGGFELGPLPDGSVALSVRAVGYSSYGRIHAVGEQDVEVVLERRPALFGRVVRFDDRSPVPFDDLLLQVSRDDRDGPWLPMDDASIDGERYGDVGEFWLYPRTRRWLRIVVACPGHVPAISDPVQLPADGTDVGPIEILVGARAGTVVTGTIVDSEGRGIGGGTVRIRTAGASRGDDGITLPRTDTTDADGAFRLGPLLPGAFDLTAGADGFVPVATRVEITAEDGRERALARLQLTRSAALEGTFCDDPVAATPPVYVRLRPLAADATNLVDTRRVTDRAFAFRDLAPGRFDVQVLLGDPRRKGSREVTRATIELVPGETRELPIGEARFGVVAGRLVVDGRPAPLQRIGLLDPNVAVDDDAAEEAVVEATTGPDGSFRLAAPPGPWLLTRRASPRAPAAPLAAVDLASDQVLQHDIDLRTTRVTGLVVDGDRPLRDVTIAFRREIAGRARCIAVVRTDAEGRFSADDLTPGPVELAVRGDRLVAATSTRVELGVGEQPVLELGVARAGSLALRVRTTATRPSEWRLEFSFPEFEDLAPRLERVADDRGLLQLPTLPPGELTLVATHDATGERVERSITIPAGDEAQYVLDLR
jgi:hypothetical protein